MLRPTPPAPGPLSRRFDAAAARESGLLFRVESTPAERVALAAECGIPGIDALDAEFRVTREGAEGLRATGRVRASVRQVCVVSLDEFASSVEETVDVRFAPQAEVEAQAAARAARPSDDEADEDLPDPIVAGRIDLGALAAEMLVLALDPHPRKPGVVFAEPADDDADAPAASPFAVLRDLKDPGRP